MKKEQVQVGATYRAKVSGGIVPVKIESEKWLGEKHAGWVGRNTATGRSVHIKSAQRLRGEVGTGGDAAKVAPEAKPVAPNATAANVAGDGGQVVASAGSPRPPTPKAKGAKAKAKPAAKKAEKPKRPSGLDAVAKVLADKGEPMTADAMVEVALKKGLWKTGGKTPGATIYAAIIRDIRDRGKESRFRKTGRGLFALSGKA